MKKDKKITVFTSTNVFIGVQITTIPNLLIKDIIDTLLPDVTPDYFSQGVWLDRKNAISFLHQSDILHIRETIVFDKES